MFAFICSMRRGTRTTTTTTESEEIQQRAEDISLSKDSTLATNITDTNNTEVTTLMDNNDTSTTTPTTTTQLHVLQVKEMLMELFLNLKI